MARRRRARCAQGFSRTYGAAYLRWTGLESATVEPVSASSVHLLNCTGITDEGASVRLGTILVGFDLTPTLIVGDADDRYFTPQTARVFLDAVRESLVRSGGIW